MRSRLVALLRSGFVIVLAMVLMRQAAAHAILVEEFPAANSVVSGPNVPLKLRFNVRIDALRSRLVLSLPDGSSRELKITPQDSPEILAAHADNLEPGAYRLHWQVLASDGHITQGDVLFQVKSD
jgi:methionine-rich copper-binding protein CopC